MKRRLETEHTDDLKSSAEVGGPSTQPRIAWPSSSPEDELAMRSSGGLLALNASILRAESPSRSDVKESPEPTVSDYFAASPMPIGKRAFDIVFAICALLLSLPILLACAIAVKLDSDGPILFRQRRLGQGGKTFFILKFRTMVSDAETVLVSYLAAHPEARKEWDADHKLRQDPRVTRLGSMMRRLSLDELPQFWNVLCGNMSMVGPRPIVPAEISKYSKSFRDYCSVHPGITGLWQVSGRNDINYSTRVALDSKYAKTFSLTLDGMIMIRTLRVVLSAAGSY